MVTSLPVPAVVGMAITGLGSKSSGISTPSFTIFSRASSISNAISAATALAVSKALPPPIVITRSYLTCFNSRYAAFIVSKVGFGSTLSNRATNDESSNLHIFREMSRLVVPGVVTKTAFPDTNSGRLFIIPEPKCILTGL